MENKDLIIIALLGLAIYLYYQNRKLKGLSTDNSRTIYELDEDLIADKDEAIRKKNEAEQENISLTNQLKNKNKEVSNKDKEITRLKDEKSKVEIALNKKITEKNKKIQELEKERQELTKHDDLDNFQTWLNADETRKQNLPDWDKIIQEVKDKISDYHLKESNWASGLLTRNTKYWQVFKQWLEEND